MLKTSELIPQDLQEALQRQHYALFGHSAVKLCHYTKASIKNEKVCYKQKFYGIESHRCLQMTPATVFCNQQCIFCWRPLAGVKTDFSRYDKPEKFPPGNARIKVFPLSWFYGGADPLSEQMKSNRVLDKFCRAAQP